MKMNKILNNSPFRNYQQYQQEIVVDEMEIEAHSVEQPPVRPRKTTPMLLGVGTLLLIAAVVAYYLPSTRTNTLPSSSSVVNDVAMMGSSAVVVACTFDECRRSSCNHELAPYTCLLHNGGVHGGCSGTPWTDESCTVQCDLSGCDDLDIPDSVGDCDVECPGEWCSMGRLCGREAPYQCTDGSSRFGCSEDRYQWTFRTMDTSCSACCKSTTCE